MVFSRARAPLLLVSGREEGSDDGSCSPRFSYRFICCVDGHVKYFLSKSATSCFRILTSAVVIPLKHSQKDSLITI